MHTHMFIISLTCTSQVRARMHAPRTPNGVRALDCTHPRTPIHTRAQHKAPTGASTHEYTSHTVGAYLYNKLGHSADKAQIAPHNIRWDTNLQAESVASTLFFITRLPEANSPTR